MRSVKLQKAPSMFAVRDSLSPRGSMVPVGPDSELCG
jgi:hypothetical protein